MLLNSAVIFNWAKSQGYKKNPMDGKERSIGFSFMMPVLLKILVACPRYFRVTTIALTDVGFGISRLARQFA